MCHHRIHGELLRLLFNLADKKTSNSLAAMGEAGGSALDIVTGNAFGRFHGFDVHTGNRRHKVYLVRLLIYNVNGMLSVVCWMAFEFIFDGMQASAPVAP